MIMKGGLKNKKMEKTIKIIADEEEITRILDGFTLKDIEFEELD